MLYNHQTSTAAEVHKQIGVHLKLAPYREGGAGKGARVVDGNPSRTHSEVQVNEDESDDQGNNDRYAIESSLHGDDPLGSRDFLSGTDVDDVEI